MHNNKLDLVGTFPDIISANLAREVLDRENIESFIEGDESANTLSILGAGVAGVRLLVNSQYSEAASRILASQAAEQETNQSWYCANCCETLGPAFDTCWSCGRARQIAASPIADDDVQYSLVAQSEQLDAEVNAVSKEVDEIVLRAWRAAIFGLAFLPFFLHLYSSYLLLSAAAAGETISPRRQRMYYGAVLINAVVFLLVAAYLRMN